MLNEYLKDLEPLVNTDCGTHNVEGVTKIAQMMKDHYDSIGFHAELVDLGPKAGKGMFATNKPGAEKFDVLLNAHLDTVFPDGTAAERPFTVKGDRAYGPGCSDCKGGVLAIFYALKNSAPEVLDKLAIAVAHNPDEEACSPNSKDWLVSLAKKSDRALVFEAARAGGQLVRSRKGSAMFEVTFHGSASHAGNAPYAGANANMAAMRFGLAAAALADPGKGTTVSPGIIQGGSAGNIISPLCKILFDVRFLKNEDGQEIEDALNKMLQSVWSPRVTQTMVRTGRIPAMPFSEDAKVLVDQICKAAELENVNIDWVDAGGASDGNHMAEIGLPVVDGCAPAGGEFHSEREFLRLDTVEERIRMMVRLLQLLAEEKAGK